MKTFDAQIDDLKKKMQSINQKKKEFIEGGTVGATKVTFKDYLKDKIDAVKEVKGKKRKQQDLMDEVSEKIFKIEDERTVLRKNVRKEFQKPAEIQA